MRSEHATPKSRPLVVQRRRRSFGLDAPRPPDVRRLERDILAWLEEQIPDALPLRAAEAQGARPLDPRGADQSSTIVLLLPCRRMVVLCIEAWPDRPGRDTLQLAEGCSRRNVPVALVSNLDETRAALRRWGFEPAGR